MLWSFVGLKKFSVGLIKFSVDSYFLQKGKHMEVLEDLFNWKRGEPMAKVLKCVNGVFKQLELLEEAMEALLPQVQATDQSSVPQPLFCASLVYTQQAES